MALQSQAYRDHPVCRAYEDAIGQLDARLEPEYRATHGLTYWREAIAEIDAEFVRTEAEAARERDRQLAEEGFRVEEQFIGPMDGYMLELVQDQPGGPWHSPRA